MTGNIVPCNADSLAQAADLLRRGELVGMPTETVYGLAADACNDHAVARIFEAKGRPRFNPLIVHVLNLEAGERIGRFDDLSCRLARAFWPGPLTLVVPRSDDCALSALVSAGLETVAIRAPDHRVAQDLLDVFGGPIAAPSANLSTQISPTSAAHVAEGLGDRVAMILDGGHCARGLESTVVTIADGQIHLLRPGMITRRDIERIARQAVIEHSGAGRPQSPGQMLKHYAPRHRLRLNADNVDDGEALLAFGPPCPGAPAAVLNLSPAANLTQAAANLFAYLRRLDASECTGIAVMPIPETGLGEAINDRLRRASHGSCREFDI